MTASVGPMRVLFLLQRAEAWGNVASVWRQMERDAAFRPTVWLLPCNAEDAQLSARRLPQHRAVLDAAGVQYVEWDPTLRLVPGQFDVVVFTHPYDRERPRGLWFDQVRGCVPRVVYIPYGLSVGAGAKNLRLQFGQPLQRGADLIVARSDAERAMYARFCPDGDVHVQVLGHPRFDALLEQVESADDGELRRRIGGRTAFLWNAHFSFVDRLYYSANFSTFELLGPEIFRLFASNADRICLVWRPHPALFPALEEAGLLAVGQVPGLRAELDVLGIVLDDAPSHLPAFMACDAHLSDSGSFWFEYLAMGRPMLPLVHPFGEPFNPEAVEVLGALGAATTPAEVVSFVQAVLSGSRRGDEEREACHRHLPLLDGEAGRRVCAAISEQRDHENPAGQSATSGVERRVELGSLAPNGLDWSASSLPCSSPILESVIAGLVKMRADRLAESPIRRRWRRGIARCRASASEWVKSQPFLMRWLLSRRDA